MPNNLHGVYFYDTKDYHLRKDGSFLTLCGERIYKREVWIDPPPVTTCFICLVKGAAIKDAV